MNLQTLAAIAVAVDVAVAVCACMGGYLMFRSTRLPAWTAALLMLPIVRALGATSAFAIDHPAHAGLPLAELVVAGAIASGLTWELVCARRTAITVSAEPVLRVAHDAPQVSQGAHADAA